MFIKFNDLEELKNLEFKEVIIYINPADPAVNPTAKKNVNSRRSLGKEFTNKFN